MSLIASISGIRGTIGGEPGENLTPVDILHFTAAYAGWVGQRSQGKKALVVVGRDGRISGHMLEQLVIGTLTGMGIDVIHLGLSTTPGVELAVPFFQADGGIILTASHNPAQWNALKLLNGEGEFLNQSDGEEILNAVTAKKFSFAPVERLGKIREVKDFDRIHISRISELERVDIPAIRKAGYKVVVDGINSVGGVTVPALLKELGVAEVVGMNAEPDGNFAHNPEPVAENLKEICELVRQHKADLGIVVDPDVDRLALVDENGDLFGEEYTLVAVADYILGHTSGNTVSNLSSSRALKDVTLKHGGEYFPAAVGEVNVVKKMKEVGAVIGGEGNGGVIYPELHYGRDALVGIALFLSHLAKCGKTCSGLRKEYPFYHMAKKKLSLSPGLDTEKVFSELERKFCGEQLNREDGLRIDFEEGWIHLRKSNTEPILRVYAEASEESLTEKWTNEVMNSIMSVSDIDKNI